MDNSEEKPHFLTRTNLNCASEFIDGCKDARTEAVKAYIEKYVRIDGNDVSSKELHGAFGALMVYLSFIRDPAFAQLTPEELLLEMTTILADSYFKKTEEEMTRKLANGASDWVPKSSQK